MAFTFDQSKDEIARLVKHFSINQLAFQAAGYKEAQARQEFIDPLFIALNWDVHNQQQAAPDYREVVVEDSLEMGRDEAQKSPDYVFRVGRDRKFFAEAKKPGVDLKTAVSPAYQLRRYAWSAKLPLSVLTDFQEWATYDCRIRPSDKDKSSAARLVYITYEEYADRWHEVWDVFSRDAVWGGSFDNFAQGSRSKRGTSEVDAEFLTEIEGWRDSLARNIALRNPDLTLDEMNDAVQRTIDRIIFLRMVEARGMEEYGQLQKIAGGGDIYANLLVLSIRADAKYNSGLFDFSKAGDQVTPRLKVDDKIIKPILEDLYYPKSPYEFSILPAEILGNVYEQFLGKVIHLTDAHHARVEEKPEVKKAGGVYYTPAYIVEYIVRNTIGKQIEGKSPAELKEFKVLDPACGSGSFLLGAYAYLLDYYRDWHAAHEPGKHKEAVTQQADGSWQLTLQERKRILTRHIYGVDIDRQAVEVTKLALLLKVLEGVKQLTLFNERALPNLDNNIKCGNSLIGPDYFSTQLMTDPDELRRVNAFDWAAEFPEAMQAGGFDCVIGNPPYVLLSNDQFSSKMIDYLGSFKVAQYKVDLFHLFIQKGIDTLKTHGLLGYIIPNTWFTLQFTTSLREYVLRKTEVKELVSFTHRVFQDANVHTGLLIVEKKSAEKDHLVLVNNLPADFKVDMLYQNKRESVLQAEWLQDNEFRFEIRQIGQSGKVVQRIIHTYPLLEEVARASLGIQAYNSSKHTREQIENRVFHANKKLSNEYLPELAGNDVARYLIDRKKGKWIKYGPWLHDYRTMDWLTGPRILIREISGKGHYRIYACYTEDTYCNYKTILNVSPSSKTNTSMKYLLGLLNSRLLSFLYPMVSNKMVAQSFPRLSVRDLKKLPIRPINFSDLNDKARHDHMVSLVEQMLDLHKRNTEAKDATEKERLARVIEATDKQIDTLVYDLYGITPEEIAIVEKRK